MRGMSPVPNDRKLDRVDRPVTAGPHHFKLPRDEMPLVSETCIAYRTVRGAIIRLRGL